MLGNETNQLIIIMGVSGSGKSTIAASLSHRQNWPMIEGDDLHPEENIEKMARGQALTNDDRMPWLDAIADAVNNQPLGPNILACSALNNAVRARLIEGIKRPCRWILLNVPASIVEQRLTEREGHFMNPSLLSSQFDALEIPEDALQMDATLAPSQICDNIMKALLNTP